MVVDTALVSPKLCGVPHAALRGQRVQSPRLSLHRAGLVQAQGRDGDQAGGGRGCRLRSPAGMPSGSHHPFATGTLGSNTLRGKLVALLVSREG